MTSITTAETEAGSTPWQLQMFSKSLKKQQKVKLLLELLGPLRGLRSLLITNGDNNGAMNYHFRAAGGDWTWGEVEGDRVPEMSAFLGDPVHRVEPTAFPFETGSFDCVVVIDVHEHLTDFEPLNGEIARVVAPGGLTVVTTPNGNPYLPVAMLKRIIGMGPAKYGHAVQGYDRRQLGAMMKGQGLTLERWGGYSKFFTELVELAINFAYVKILSRRKKGPAVAEGEIAPSSGEQLIAVQKTYRRYALVYPLVRAFSSLDVLIPGRGGYAVAVAARKPRS